MNTAARLRVWGFYLLIHTGTHISGLLLFPSKILLWTQAFSHKPHGNIFHLFICSTGLFLSLTAGGEAATFHNESTKWLSAIAQEPHFLFWYQVKPYHKSRQCPVDPSFCLSLLPQQLKIMLKY